MAAGAVESSNPRQMSIGDDVGALLGQPHRVAAALTARRPGDERDLALDPTGHPTLLVLGKPCWAIAQHLDCGHV